MGELMVLRFGHSESYEDSKECKATASDAFYKIHNMKIRIFKILTELA